MSHLENLVRFAEELTYSKTGRPLSELQLAILISTLQKERKTYDQLANDFRYSPRYVKQDVAPKLWQLFSEIFAQKVTKFNIKSILEEQMRLQLNVVDSSLPIVSSSDSTAKGTILLIDDYPQNLRLLSDVLEEQGYEVQQAINGVVALKAIPNKVPDLILLDIQMPDLDGYTVCQILKDNPQTRDIPVIFISGLDEAWDKVKAFSVGGSDYISKPFKTLEVLARVENQLKIRRLQQELKQKELQLQQALEKQQLEQVTYCPHCSKKLS